MVSSGSELEESGEVGGPASALTFPCTPLCSLATPESGEGAAEGVQAAMGAWTAQAFSNIPIQDSPIHSASKLEEEVVGDGGGSPEWSHIPVSEGFPNCLGSPFHLGMSHLPKESSYTGPETLSYLLVVLVGPHPRGCHGASRPCPHLLLELWSHVTLFQPPPPSYPLGSPKKGKGSSSVSTPGLPGW